MNHSELAIFALNASRPFGEAVSGHLGIQLEPHEERDYEDGEHMVWAHNSHLGDARRRRWGPAASGTSDNSRVNVMDAKPFSSVSLPIREQLLPHPIGTVLPNESEFDPHCR